jgi:N utilization substance protein A
MAVSANKLELLQIADAVAREKAIDRGIVIAAMEDAIAKAAKSRYGAETEVRAELNPKSGELRLFWKRRAGTTPPPRSATPSRTRCRRSNTGASPPNRPSR